MKKFSLYIMILGVLGVLGISCIPEKNVIWEGLQVEFDAASRGGSSGVYLRENDGVNKSDGVLINLVGVAQSSDVSITWELDPSSTAIAGVQYVLPTTSNTVTIPAGQFGTEIPFEIIADNIESGETWTLVFNMVSATINGTEVTIAENFKQVVHTIEISCPPNIPTTGATYTGTTTAGAFGVTGNNSGVTITGREDGLTYDISDFSASFFTAFGGVADYPGTFTNVCDVITLIDGSTEFGGCETDPANGAPTGTWNAGTGVLTIPWYNANNDFAEVSEFTLD